MIKIILIACLVNSVCCYNTALKRNKTFTYNSYPYDEIITISVNNTTEYIMDFYENSTDLRGYPTRVHVLKTMAIDPYPVFISAVQEKAISSWSVPLVVETPSWALVFLDTSRTLCPRDAGPDKMSENRPTVQISTSSPTNVSVDIKLRRVLDFYVEVNKTVELKVKPSTPKYYYFSFDQHPWNITDNGLLGSLRSSINYTMPKSVILIIESNSTICAAVSIQNKSCPVRDNEKNVLYEGYYLTMTTKGGITITQSMYPSGFYIAFVVKQSDDDCTGKSDMPDMFGEPHNWDGDRLKDFRFRIVGTISKEEYIVGALVAPAVVLLVVLLVLALLVLFRNRSTEAPVVREQVIVQDPVPSNSSENEDDGAVLVNNQVAPEREGPLNLTVDQLCRSTPERLAWRSHRYFWGALTIAIVYALPVVQILIIYQRMVFQTGNQDLCYYNFLCAHPLGYLSDFNHVYSNVGYIVLGLVFLVQVLVRQLASARRGVHDKGIPQHYGLLFSMGLGLIMEGLLSGSYHLCPNQMNFQFDTSFMYVIAVLCMLKLYQNRHSDLIPSAHSTFIALALIITMGLAGILLPGVGFSVCFTLIHIFACFILTLKIYYAGTLKLEWSLVPRAWVLVRQRGRAALVPRRRVRGALLGLANVANWALVIYLPIGKHDFATKILIILMSNTFLYTVFYVVMKSVHREKILIHTGLYGILAFVTWIYAATQFVDSKTLWSETPAQSRQQNSVCTFLTLYDSHDMWHIASAAAIYLSFNMLLTIDDNLINTPRNQLPVF